MKTDDAAFDSQRNESAGSSSGNGGEHPSGLQPTAFSPGSITAALETALRELAQAGGIRNGQLVVIGCSTSEVAGRRIGTSGTLQVAGALFEGVERVRREIGFHVAFQCCEHLNRALVVEREWLERSGLDEVAVIPVPGAGGSMAAYAFRHLPQAAVVERIRAHAGVDIGDTLIGMHLKPVAVPFRSSVRRIGAAHVTAAYTRPKLIGGARAVYTIDSTDKSAGDCR